MFSVLNEKIRKDNRNFMHGRLKEVSKSHLKNIGAAWKTKIRGAGASQPDVDSHRSGWCNNFKMPLLLTTVACRSKADFSQKKNHWKSSAKWPG